MKVEDNVVGYDVVTATKATKKDGFWNVLQTLKQGRLLEGGEWEWKEVSMRATNKDLGKASDITTASILIYLESVGGDLFSGDGEVPQTIETNGDLIQ